MPVEDAFADDKYFFHYHPWAYYNFEAILSYFKYLKTYKGAKNIAIAYEDGPFGSSRASTPRVAAFKKAGFNVVLTEKFKTGSGNFGPLVSKAKAANPDILLLDRLRHRRPAAGHRDQAAKPEARPGLRHAAELASGLREKSPV